MKKIVGIIAAAALAATAFAEINIGSWNRGVFVPFAYDGDTLRSLEGPSWGVDATGGIRTGLSFSASSENAGVVFDIHGNPGASIAMGDNAYAWVKPVDMLTVKFGKMDNNWGRLDHCFGTWDYWRFSNERGEGLAGVGRQNGRGAEITLQPVEGLVIDYEANFDYGTVTYDTVIDPEKGVTTTTTAGNHTYNVMWENSSTMIGYQADFGFIRAIINGQAARSYKAGEDTKPAATFGLAADITAIENLTLKVGFGIPTYLQSSDSYVKAAVAADYNLDALALHAQVSLDVLPNKKKADNNYELGNMGFNVGAGVDYAFNDAWKLVTDVRFQSWSNTETEADGADTKIKLVDPSFGAYIGLQQNLTNASFAFGAMFGKRSMNIANSTGKADDFTFAVPLSMTVSF
ncbi:hypothetical protein MSI_01800 [Treponema sp. JC4]|uniref:hypothetical protein n=1 Tax=Treponema sp. JC4 TaxID=1124982 RepID=UPI00025B0BA2|nr:hypothetical protein [Treponema sp. JC4]EID86224.1 hypothetical protein MSI_01800 [Treponema sp. JC4]